MKWLIEINDFKVRGRVATSDGLSGPSIKGKTWSLLPVDTGTCPPSFALFPPGTWLAPVHLVSCHAYPSQPSKWVVSHSGLG